MNKGFVVVGLTIISASILLGIANKLSGLAITPGFLYLIGFVGFLVIGLGWVAASIPRDESGRGDGASGSGTPFETSGGFDTSFGDGVDGGDGGDG